MPLNDQDRDALFVALGSRGGRVLLSMLDEQADEPKDELYEIMASRPDTLTGKTAVKLAAKSKALRSFKESLLEEIRFAPSNQPQPGRAG